MVERYLRVIVVAVIVLCAGVGVKAEGVYEAWVARYDGPSNNWDEPYSLKLDKNGKIYVTGYSEGCTTIGYDTNGIAMWVNRFDLNGSWGITPATLVVDGEGNPYVNWSTSNLNGGIPSGDFFTLKLTPMEDKLWVRYYNGDANLDDDITAAVLDLDDNIIVTGPSESTTNSTDILTIKYTPSGETLWVRRLGKHGPNDFPSSITVDKSNNIYVAGSSESYGLGIDYVLAKYSPSGDLIWVRTYAGPGGGADRVTKVVTDDSNNVCVTGFSSGDGSGFDYATVKYSPAGDTMWVRRYNGTGNREDRGIALAADKSGNLYVTGYSWGHLSAYDYLTIKYSPKGEELWVRRYNGPSNKEDYASDLVLDSVGNVYVTGRSWGNTYDYCTIKYSPDGNLLWNISYNGPVSGNDYPSDMELDHFGNVYVTGRSHGISQGIDPEYAYDYATVKYSPCLKSADLNGDSKTSIVDLVYLVNILFKSWPIPGPACLVDVNGDSLFSLSDVIYLANHVFKFGPAPVKAGPCCD